ncbi:MAG: hypothetical protein WBW16_08245 [Bacteroidota bacterium]
MKSGETVGQSVRSTDHRFILHLTILYGAVILVLGLVWGAMIIR